MSLQEQLKQFQTINLSEMGKVHLLNRRDTKHLFSLDRLEALLLQLTTGYRILKVGGNRIPSYKTVYYDTPDFEMYLQHQNSRVNRNKIRTRTYLNSNITYIEVKFKNNQGHTLKKRARVDKARIPDFIAKHTPYRFADLEKKVTVFYSRMTLVDLSLTERITIDIDLKYRIEKSTYLFPGLVILELKQNRLQRKSDINRVLRDLRIFPAKLSKYCFGIALHYIDIKKNRYKCKIREINSIVGRYG